MTQFTPFASLIGGAFIGIAASILLLFNGRILGISGIIAGIAPVGDRGWRLLFLAALFFVGVVASIVAPSAFGDGELVSWPAMIIAGLLVGVGTRLGSGCTSGHGVCGLPRFSPRSLVATASFMGAGIVTVALTRHVLGIL
jgi:uncharacterized membrane protein YedE/YeeE